MLRRLLILVLLVSAGGARAAGWFDAGIAGYATWPADGTDYAVPGIGVWSNTRAATLSTADASVRLVLDTPLNQALHFTNAVRPSTATDEVSVTMRVAFTPGNLPSVDPMMKGAVTVVGKSAADSVYYALVRDGVSTTNVWTAMTGACPLPERVGHAGHLVPNRVGRTSDPLRDRRNAAHADGRGMAADCVPR